MVSAKVTEKLARLSPDKRALYELRLKKLAAQMAKSSRSSIPKRQGEGPWAASIDQSALWFFHQLEPGTAAYNIGVGRVLTGPLRVGALERAFNEMIRCHEVLRTTFEYRDGRLVQVIGASLTQSIPLIDMSGLAGEDRERQMETEVPRLIRAAFDLQSGPLIRLPLIRVNGRTHVFVAVLHHMVTDWWSYQLFFRQLMSAYLDFVDGRPATLPELPVQFADYAVYRNRWLESESFEKQLGYWTNKLKDASLVLELPTDRPRPPVQSYRGARAYTNDLPREILAGIRAMGRRARASSLMTTLAAVFAFLYRYTGAEDILIGTPTTDREHEDIENMIGYLLNVLVIRCQFYADAKGRRPTFTDLVAQVKQNVLEALAHKDLPFRCIVEALNPERDLSRMPIYQVDFNHVAADGPVFRAYRDLDRALHREGYQFDLVDFNRGVSDVDLQISFTEGLNRIDMVIEYATDLFDRQTIDHMSALMVRLLGELTQHPDTPVSRLGWMSPSEKRELLITWNQTSSPYPREACVQVLFEAQTQRIPDAVAIVHERFILTYKALDARSERVAAHLIGQGLNGNEPVGLCLSPGPDWVASMLGVFKAGGAYVPLDSELPAARLAFMLRDTGMAMLVTRSDMIDALPAFELGFLNVLVLDEEEFSKGSDRPLARSHPAEAVAYVIYTSGTTGRPKGVQVTHRNITRLVSDTRYLALKPGDGMGQASNISFDAHVFEVWTVLGHGGRLCIIEKDTFLSPDALAVQIARQRIDILFITTALFNQLVRAQPQMFAGMKYLLFGGERVDPESVRAVLDRGAPGRLLHVYGPTETTTFSSWHAVAAVVPGAWNVPIGGPIAQTRLYLFDRDFEQVPWGVVGELCIAGDGLARGYLNDPALTAARFVPDPFPDYPGRRLYRSGDLVKRLADGAIEFSGRRDSQVKLRGFRVELGELEAVLTAHPSVVESVAVIRERQSGAGPRTKQLVAYVKAGEETRSGIDTRSLLAHLEAKLPEYMVPTAIAVVDRFPLTANGKIDLQALPDPDRPSDEESHTPPRNRKERILTDVWAAALNLDRVGIHDNFFEVGGDSILAIQIVSEANRLGLELATKHIFESQTIAELAERAGDARSVEAEQGAVTGKAPLTPIQHWFFDRGLRNPNHFNMALLLCPGQRVEAKSLGHALKALAVHHDALRLRFVRDDGGWYPYHAPPEEGGFDLEEQDLSAEPDPERAMLSAAERQQGSLDLARGPLAKAVLFELGETSGQRLLLIIHHLIMDGVSWRILLEDLETAYVQSKAGRPIRLRAKTTSWKEWAQRLVAFAESEAPAAELPFWQAIQARSVPSLPIANPHGPNHEATTRTVKATLGADETRSLLERVPPVYNTRMNDILLTALVMAMGEETGADAVYLNLETHGRGVEEAHPLFEDVDLSRTVGWFTAMFPVALNLNGFHRPGDALKAVKEQLRAIPANGIGFGLLSFARPDGLSGETHPPKIGFNYLGRIGETAGESLFRIEPETVGSPRAPENERAHLLEIDALVVDGRLTLVWQYGGEVLATDLIERLAKGHIHALRTIVAHCLASEAGGRTPSDFPLAKLSQDKVDRLLASYSKLDDIQGLTPMQQGMLFHTLREPGSTVYIDQLSLRLRGDLDSALFREAWRLLTERHAALRSIFVFEGEAPLQLALRDHPLNWREESIGSEAVSEWLERDLGEGFPLDREPPTRFTVLRHGERDFTFVWTFHHILMDGWSLAVFLEETVSIYGALRAGRQPELPRVKPFGTYLKWLSSRDMEAARTYWRRLLEGFTEPSSLVTARRAEGGGGKHAEHEWRLSRQESAAIQTWARTYGMTPGTLFQGVWAVIVNRYACTGDVLFGVTVSGRPAELQDVTRMVGNFINTLPLRVQVSPGRTVVPWLKRIQDQLSDSRRYEYSSLAEIQQLGDLAPGVPLFDTFVVFENYPVDSALERGWAGMTLENLRIFEQANYPLAFQAAPGERIGLRLRYNPILFEPEGIARMAGQINTLFEGMVGYPDGDVTRLPMLSGEERTRILVTWNDTKTEYPGDHGIHELFEAQAAITPEAPALFHEAGVWTYATLNARANLMAHQLVGLGIGTNEMVAICLREERPHTFAAILGTLKAGGIYVPLDPDLPQARLRYILADARASLMITEPGLMDFDHGIQRSLTVDPNEQPQGESVENLPHRPRHSSWPVYVMYTSGSTGEPKGVVVPNRGVVRLVKNTNYIRIEPGDRLLQAAVLSFDAATVEIWGPLLNGASVVLMASRAIDTLPELLVRYRVTIVFLTPRVFNLAVELHLDAFSWVRHTLVGGDVVSATHVARFLDVYGDHRLIAAYGPTEGTTFTTCTELNRRAYHTIPIGKPIANTRVHLLDPLLNPAPQGAVADLFIGGDGLACGYLHRPDLTAKCWVPNPFVSETEAGERLYRSGDLARYLVDGSIAFHGRRDDQIKIRGFRIELGEIEHQLRSLAWIEDAVVLAEEKADGEKLLSAFLIAAADVPVDERGPAQVEKTRRALASRLPDYMVPVSMGIYESLPLTPHGKIDRRKLSELGDREPLPGRSFQAPKTSTEEAVIAAWSEILDMPRIGVDDHFFRLGGHSLYAARVVNNLRARLGVELPLQAIFQYPVAADLAEYIEIQKWSSQPGDTVLEDEEGRI